MERVGMATPSADDEHVQLQLGLYVLGMLPDDEHFLVDEHLALCAACRADFAAVSDARAFLDRLTPAQAAALADEFSPPERRQDGAVPRPTREPAAGAMAPARPAPAPRPSAPQTPRGGPSRPASAATARGRRDPARGRRPFRLVLSATAAALVIGIGVGAWLISATPVAITLAGSETNTATGVSMSVSVVERDGASHVDASVTGLTKGRDYQLYAVDVRGLTVVVTRWVATEDRHTVAGEVHLATKDLAFFSVAEVAGGVVVTVRVAKSARQGMGPPPGLTNAAGD